MDLTTTRKLLKLGYQYHLTLLEYYLYCCFIRLLMKQKYLLLASLPHNQCLPYVTSDQLACLCVWKRQAAVVNETGSLSFSSGRSPFLSWIRNLLPPWIPSSTALDPWAHTQTQGLPHHPLLTSQGLEWEGRGRMECQSRGLPFPYSILPSSVTHFWVAVDPIRGP